MGPRRRVSPSLAFSLLAFSLALVSCARPDVELTVDPPASLAVSRVGLRVWDTEMRLVADHWLEVGEAEGQVAFPWTVPLRAAGEARWYVAEIELYDADLCPVRRAVVSGRSGDPAPPLELVDTGMAGCAAAFVDPSGGPGGCTEESPCADVDGTLGQITRDGRPEVVYLRGEVDHVARAAGGLVLEAGRGSGEAGAPFILRAWPGTGTPRVRTSAPEDGVVRFCCNVGAGHHVIVDGLDIAGGARFGVELNGEQARDNVVRHCVIHDNGLDVRAGPDDLPQQRGRRDAAIIAFNDATDNVFEHNVLRDTGVRGPGSPAELPGVGARVGNGATLRDNLIVGNSEEGVQVSGGVGDVTIERNVVCDNAAGGIIADRGARVRHNTVAANGGTGIALEDAASRTTNNLVVSNGGVGLSAPGQGDGDWLHGNGDGRSDGDPQLSDLPSCVVTLRPGSPVLGARGGDTPGAR